MNRSRFLLAVVLCGLVACSGGNARVQQPAVTSAPAVTPSLTPSDRNAEALRFAAVGDIGDGSAAEYRLARAMATVHRRDPLDLLLLLGDLIYPRGDPAQYRQKFARPYAPVLRTGIETVAVLGNHDQQTDTGTIMRLFRMPARYHTFTLGLVQFFALDSTPGPVLRPERAWLRRELARARAPWKVAFFHVPPFSSGTHGSNPTIQEAFVDLFERYDVDLVLAGHDHNYERTRPIRGVTYVVSGGGCCPRRVGRSSFTAIARTELHFVVIEARADELMIEAVAANGRVFDRATLARKRAAA